MQNEVQQQTADRDGVQNSIEEGQERKDNLPPIEGDQEGCQKLRVASEEITRRDRLFHLVKRSVDGLYKLTGVPHYSLLAPERARANPVPDPAPLYCPQEEQEDAACANDQIHETIAEAAQYLTKDAAREIMAPLSNKKCLCKRCGEPFQAWNASYVFCDECEDEYQAYYDH